MSHVKARTWLLVGAVLMGLVGAMLVFALDDRDAKLIGLELPAAGGVLMILALLLIVGLAIDGMGDGGSSNSSGSKRNGDINSIKAIGGLIAVVTSVAVVGSLAAFTITRLSSDDENSAIAIASSAFGVISALAGAYLGIKISADQNNDARAAEAAEQEVETAKDKEDTAKREASRAQAQADAAAQKAEVVAREMHGMTSKVAELEPEQAKPIIAAAREAGEKAERPPGPREGR